MSDGVTPAELYHRHVEGRKLAYEVLAQHRWNEHLALLDLSGMMRLDRLLALVAASYVHLLLEARRLEFQRCPPDPRD